MIPIIHMKLSVGGVKKKRRRWETLKEAILSLFQELQIHLLNETKVQHMFLPSDQIITMHMFQQAHFFQGL